MTNPKQQLEGREGPEVAGEGGRSRQLGGSGRRRKENVLRMEAPRGDAASKCFWTGYKEERGARTRLVLDQHGWSVLLQAPRR